MFHRTDEDRLSADGSAVEGRADICSLLNGLKAPAVPLGKVAADPRAVFVIMRNHGRQVIERETALDSHIARKFLSVVGFSVFAAAADKDIHQKKFPFLPSSR